MVIIFNTNENYQILQRLPCHSFDKKTYLFFILFKDIVFSNYTILTCTN